MKKIFFIFGTRPEAIKLAPLIQEFQAHKKYKTIVCVTSQHKEMLWQVLKFFAIKPHYDLKIMKKGQSLFEVTAMVLKRLEAVLEKESPDVVVVQGDTTSAMVGALAAYYKKIKIAHVEAGLRSGDKYSPFPEEGNRKIISCLADWHLAPTLAAANKLKDEGISNGVWVTGNTVIDALHQGLQIIKCSNTDFKNDCFSGIDFSKRILLVTGHRRENFGEPLKQISRALKYLAVNHPEVEIVYPVHLNPNVLNPVMDYLGGILNIHLIKPLPYPQLIWLMSKSYIIITDSGGIQEEAPSLGKPILVTREVTERAEGLKAGTAKLVGHNKNKIVNEVESLLTDQKAYRQMSKAVNPYGNGESAKLIFNILTEKLSYASLES